MSSHAPRSRVIVVGGGITGSSIAYHCAVADADVTVLDAAGPGSGVTQTSFAWIGSSGVRTGPAAAMRVASTDDYHRLEAELPGLPVRWCGALEWRTTGDVLTAGPGQTIVDAATVGDLEPRLRRPPEQAVWSPEDGAVDPTGVVTTLLDAARAHGAQVRPHTAATAVRRDPAGRLAAVDTTAGPLDADTVVLAAGTVTAALAASVGVTVPVEPSPAMLVRLWSPTELVRRVVTTEFFDLRQVCDDQLIAATDSAQDAVSAIRTLFRDADEVEVVGSTIGARPMPVDGEPLIGPIATVPGLYVATMHAAVTLAPIVGRLVASEVVGGRVEPMLTGCRLDRFG